MNLDYDPQVVRDLNGKTVIGVEQAGRLVGLGRTHAYREARRYIETKGAEGLPVLKWGRKMVCPTAKVLALLGLRVDEQAPAGRSEPTNPDRSQEVVDGRAP